MFRIKLIINNLLYLFFYFRKPYSGRKDDRSQYSSNSYDHKKKQDYSDKKEKVPSPNIELKNNKSNAIKDQVEKTKEPEPPKPEEKPNSE